jgi:hypothetical protein
MDDEVFHRQVHDQIYHVNLFDRLKYLVEMIFHTQKDLDQENRLVSTDYLKQIFTHNGIQTIRKLT